MGTSMGWLSGLVALWLAVRLTACEKPGGENLKSGRTGLPSNPRQGLEKQTRKTVEKDDQELSTFFSVKHNTVCVVCTCVPVCVEVRGQHEVCFSLALHLILNLFLFKDFILFLSIWMYLCRVYAHGCRYSWRPAEGDIP